MSETDSELNARSLKEILSLTSTLRSGYEKLVAENDKLRAALDWYLEWYTKERAMSDELHLPPEIESLRQAYLSALRGWTGEIERLRTEAARLSAENEQFRVQDETIRAEFGGKRDGRPTIECLREAFAAKWSADDTLFQATLDMKTEELRAEVERLAAENEKISALRATCNCGGLETGNHFSDCPYALALETPRRAIEIIELRARVSELDEKADRLAAENEKLRAALEPFASMGKAVMGRKHHNEAVISYALAPTVKIHHFVAAHLHVSALQDKSDE